MATRLKVGSRMFLRWVGDCISACSTRLVTAGLIKYGDLQTMTLDEIDDINITLAYEEQARERLRRRLAPPKEG